MNRLSDPLERKQTQKVISACAYLPMKMFRIPLLIKLPVQYCMRLIFCLWMYITITISRRNILGYLFTARGGGTPYNALYGEASPERGTFFRLQVYERVEISQVEVYKRVGKPVI